MSDPVLRALPAIYDAAINPDSWSEALDAAIPIVGAKQGGLLVSDLRDAEPFSFSHHSACYRTPIGRRNLKFYMENMVRWEADSWPVIRAQPKHTIIRDVDVWPDLNALRSRPDARFLQEEFGCFRRIAARLNGNRCWFDTLSLQFDVAVENFPEAAIEAMRMLVPHFAKSIELGRAFNLLNSRYQAVLSALDHVQIGMCIALSEGDVIVMNCEAERILDQDDGIRLAKDRTVACRDPDTGRVLAAAIQAAAHTSGGAGNTAEIIMAVQRRSGAQPLLIEVTPLRDCAREVETGLEGALVAVIDPENTRPFSTAMVAEAYGLTPAESEVCSHLVDGWTNGRIAEERRVSLDTVKTQIASIFQKTLTRRRSELIRLVLKSSPPIAMPDIRA